MEMKINTKALRRALTILRRVIPSRGAAPVVTRVLWDVDPAAGRITLTGTDLDAWVSSPTGFTLLCR